MRNNDGQIIRLYLFDQKAAKMSDISEYWEEHSIDEEEAFQGGTSEEEEGSSDEGSSPDEREGEDGDEEAEVRGVEPYRFEPLAVPAVNQPGDGDRQAEDDEPNPDDRRLNTDWCSCGHCVIQPLLTNCICCKEVEKPASMMRQLDIIMEDPNQCLTIHEWFDSICLHPGVLATAYLQYRAYYGRDAVEGTLDQKYRHVAYRQVVRWCWGYLGRFNRVPLPSCVMAAIRRTFPNPDGQYKGFSFPPLD